MLLHRELGGSAAAEGSLNDITQPWQTLPPAHGSTFERYDVGGTRAVGNPPAETSAEEGGLDHPEEQCSITETS